MSGSAEPHSRRFAAKPTPIMQKLGSGPHAAGRRRHRNFRPKPEFSNCCKRLEATPGIEPGCTDLQSVASPLRHVAFSIDAGWWTRHRRRRPPSVARQRGHRLTHAPCIRQAERALAVQLRPTSVKKRLQPGRSPGARGSSTPLHQEAIWRRRLPLAILPWHWALAWGAARRRAPARRRPLERRAACDGMPWHRGGGLWRRSTRQDSA